MSSSLRALQSLLIGGLGAALFVVTASGQSGSASEATHFIETPNGWVHPKTAWGDPDLTGMWPVSFVGTGPDLNSAVEILRLGLSLADVTLGFSPCVSAEAVCFS